jgi:hypothetical protein
VRTDLLFEAQSLLEGIVKLGVGVTKLLSTHEALEALAKTRAGAMPLGEWGHYLRMPDY